MKHTTRKPTEAEVAAHQARLRLQGYIVGLPPNFGKYSRYHRRIPVPEEQQTSEIDWHWLPPVATKDDLPIEHAVQGDARMVEDEIDSGYGYQYDGEQWVRHKLWTNSDWGRIKELTKERNELLAALTQLARSASESNESILLTLVGHNVSRIWPDYEYGTQERRLSTLAEKLEKQPLLEDLPTDG